MKVPLSLVSNKLAVLKVANNQNLLPEQSCRNGLSRDLNLSKKPAQLLEFRLREHNLFAKGMTFYWYCNLDEKFRQHFT